MMSNNNNLPPARTYKRLIAMVYDCFLVFAVLMFASAIPLVFTGGEAMASSNPFMSVYLLLVIFVFFAWFWTRSGQTLGMQAWKIKLVRQDESLISWQQSLARFALAIPAWSVFTVGIIIMLRADKIEAGSMLNKLTFVPAWVYILVGIIWLVIDNLPNNWREKLTHTHVVQLPKN